MTEMYNPSDRDEHRLSRNQQSVLDFLHQQDGPLSAQELYATIRQHHPMGLATVYRALETLKLHGLIRVRTGAHGESLYSPILTDDHFLTCLQCGRSFPLDNCPVKDWEMSLPRAIPFKIYYHTLEFFGLCECCILQIQSMHP